MCAVWRRIDQIEMAKFASVGVLNTLVGLAIIYAFKWYLHWGDAAANLLGYSIGIALGFVLNARWTFAMPAVRTRHLLGYLLVSGVAYLMNLMAVLASIEMMSLSGDFAQLVGVPVFTLTSYLLNKIYVFASKH